MKNAVFAAFLLLLFHCTEAQNARDPNMPTFHSAKRIGCYPNTAFLHTLAATGERPIAFAAQNLPIGLVLDKSTGIISGTIPQKGIYEVAVSATNSLGQAHEKIVLCIGDTLALTPPMGWNSWNVFAWDIDEKTVMEIADAMVSTGMRNLGYQYINIDDFWHAESRDESGKPVVDAKKFPNGMKFLSDYVHSKGLKLGIYSCAGSLTCGKKFGGYQYEEIDAKTYAEWGIDLLKYDYCFAPWGRKAAVKRYASMGDALKKSGRSIVFSVCEWGLRKPWKWAPAAGGQYWRTTPDIFDYWKGWHPWQKSFMSILKFQKGLEKYAGPGRWNDPDMLTVGNYGMGRATSAKGKYKGMSDVQYQSHFALWCMLNSPLLSSCDLRSMTQATKDILMNAELISINQDVAGKQAALVYNKKGIRVYRKGLMNNQTAIAILNTKKKPQRFAPPQFLQKQLAGKARVNLITSTISSEVVTELSLQPYETIVWLVE